MVDVARFRNDFVNKFNCVGKSECYVYDINQYIKNSTTSQKCNKPNKTLFYAQVKCLQK
jgi:hypothetical protein